MLTTETDHKLIDGQIAKYIRVLRRGKASGRKEVKLDTGEIEVTY